MTAQTERDVKRDPETGRVQFKNRLAVRHGAYSFLKTGRVPSIRGKKRIQRQLNELRRSLMDAVPGSEDPRKQILIAQAVKCHGFIILIEEYVKRAGILRADRFRRGVMEAQPVLDRVISFMNAQQRAITALGLDSAKAEAILAPYEITAQEEKKK